MTETQSRALVEFVHQLQPACLVSGRVGNHLGDYPSSRDNVIPGEHIVEIDWETPATINNRCRAVNVTRNGALFDRAVPTWSGWSSGRAG
jgi:hypothetical protein